MTVYQVTAKYGSYEYQFCKWKTMREGIRMSDYNGWSNVDRDWIEQKVDYIVTNFKLELVYSI